MSEGEANRLAAPGRHNQSKRWPCRSAWHSLDELRDILGALAVRRLPIDDLIEPGDNRNDAAHGIRVIALNIDNRSATRGIHAAGSSWFDQVVKDAAGA
jgi:hypothetical protein